MRLNPDRRGRLLDLARERGTPLYVYDAEVVERRLAELRDAFAAFEPEVLYAMKANPCAPLLTLLRRLGTGLDTVSPFEVRIGLAAGFDARSILFTPNGVAFDELAEALARGVRVDVECLSHLERMPRGATCGLRLAPTDANDWHARSKFGIAPEHVERALEVVAERALVVDRLHVHTSHAVQGPETFVQAAAALLDYARRLPDVVELDLGGGYLVPTGDGRPVTPPRALAEALREPWERFASDTGRALRLLVEPGRYLAAEAGVLLVTVQVRKSNGGVEWALVDSGFHQLVRPKLYCAYLGIENLGIENLGIENLTNAGASPRAVTVAGQLCEADEFAVERELADPREGDVLAIANAGAYGFAMSSNYNARPRPAEVWIEDGAARLVRRRESLADMRATEVL